MKIEVYTDGACSGNPGPGGYGVFLTVSDKRWADSNFSGHAEDTTNNRMELTAAIIGLRVAKLAVSNTGPAKVVLYSDSKYVVDNYIRYLPGWVKKNWHTASNKPVKNQDLWKLLIAEASAIKDLEWVYVKGHADNPGNIEADRLATEALKTYKEKVNELDKNKTPTD